MGHKGVGRDTCRLRTKEMKQLKIIGLYLSRLVLGVTFIFSGFVKAVDPLGTAYKIEDYLRAAELYKLAGFGWLTLGGSVLVSAIEFILGIMLLFGIKTRATNWLTLVFMTIMTVLTLLIASGLWQVGDCGCFGDAVPLSNAATLIKNIILLALALVIYVLSKRISDKLVLPKALGTVVLNASVIAIIALAAFCLYDLPIIDFRPYKVGADLRDLPDFFAETQEGDDVTEQIVDNQGLTYLLVAPQLETASDAYFGRLDIIYEQSQENNIPFYCLTESGQMAIDRWCDITGAEYTFLISDATELKTIIRSNPGLVLIEDGKIIKKWSNNNLPKNI